MHGRNVPGLQEIEDATRAIVMLHNQLGHLSGLLLRALLERETPWWIQRLAQLPCSACDRCNRQASTCGSGKVSELLDTLQIDEFDRVHPVTGMRAKGSLMADDRSSQTVVIHQRAADGRGMGNTTREEMLVAILQQWVRHRERPVPIRSVPSQLIAHHPGLGGGSHHPPKPIEARAKSRPLTIWSY